jgi:NAD-dependent dihydropyrimidine dehydrogenase PreA subunit
MAADSLSFHSCSGCGLCLLACPVWRQTSDIRLTPHGRAKALQQGASAAALGASIASCTLCGSCEPACPEEIPLVDLILDLRRQHPLQAQLDGAAAKEAPAGGGTVLLPGRALRANGERLARVAGLLDASIAADDGSDIGLALEAGAELPPGRIDRFLESLGRARRLVVAEGLLLRRLREWLPGRRIEGLGVALSTLASVRGKLRASDFYVIEPRAFHGDHARLVGHYDRMRSALELGMNLDLQRLAVATGASGAQHALGLPAIDAADQARWILEGRAFERVVVEDPGDCAVYASVTDRPVVHLADL